MTKNQKLVFLLYYKYTVLLRLSWFLNRSKEAHHFPLFIAMETTTVIDKWDQDLSIVYV